jgi:hypothetical protein
MWQDLFAEHPHIVHLTIQIPIAGPNPQPRRPGIGNFLDAGNPVVRSASQGKAIDGVLRQAEFLLVFLYLNSALNLKPDADSP